MLAARIFNQVLNCGKQAFYGMLQAKEIYVALVYIIIKYIYMCVCVCVCVRACVCVQ